MPNVIISPTGVQGPRGNAVLNGTGAPGPTVGIDGDYYIDKTGYPTSVVLYGPKAAGAWPGSGVTVGGGAVGALLAANNLSDLQNAGAARTNLGLGTAATQSAGAFDAFGAASAALGSANSYTASQIASEVTRANNAYDALGAASTAQAAAIADAAGKYQGLQPWVFDVTATAYGAAGDAQVVADGAMSSGSAVLTSATANWPATGIVGKSISVKGAGALGVTTLVTTIASRQSATQITLNAANASGGALTGAVVIWGTDDTAAVQAATDAAMTYLQTHSYAQVFNPRLSVIAGPLNTSKHGNGQIVFDAVSTAGGKKILEFRGVTSGAAAVRHWLQQVPQMAGSGFISFGVYASTGAQIASINAAGNPAVISGPNEGSGYGAGANFSNMMVVVRDLLILTTHSAYGLTYGALNLYGVANAHIENLGYGTAGTVASPSTDYTSPGTFGTGLSVGCLLPAPGNNDYVIAKNVSIGGGYTYAMFMTEHGVIDRYMALYCWAGLCAVGNYAGSVGSVHAMDAMSASIEACASELYIVGAGSGGAGPTVYANISTESSAPIIAGNSTGAMNAALGRVRLTGLFTESGVSTSAPTGIEVVNGQVPRAIKRKTSAFTCSVIDRTLVCDTTTAGFTGTLPAADFCPTEYVFKNVGTNTLTVGTTGGQLIYSSSGTGAATATLTTGQTGRYQALYNGTSWGWYAV
ncbi:hypothetical protein STRTUCAR8_08562 [Streptomyces turgidiscabies Car8]|uniref:Uncharacterized protein n=1 Tax=Streptomyces turgidiscabies (strain Car8) TaxID=698760 RepID=L7F7V3_STRT8|nr:hypothetical protein [Streptomyces turgidiscabies]ELP67673.1 hypothetical protein STRTUCAR8_08562 [Streptomyces turgidiscabies Car8]